MNKLASGSLVNGLLVGLLCLSSGCTTLSEAYNPNSLDQRITSAQTRWRTTGSGFSIPGLQKSDYHHAPKLQNIVDRLVYKSPLRSFNVRAYVVSNDAVNAQTDGQNIYVFKGLLDLVGDNQNALVGVLAHELGHIIGNHAKGRFTRQVVESITASLSANIENKTANSILEEILSLSSAAYSRHEEKEADAIGAILSHEAGYDASGLLNFFRLSQEKKGQDLVKYAAVLLPSIGAYNTAIKNYNQSVGVFRISRSRQAYANALYWGKTAQNYAKQIKIILYQFADYLGATNPLYLTHPPDNARMATVELIQMRKLGTLSDAQLFAQDGSIGKVFSIIEARRPKN